MEKKQKNDLIRILIAAAMMLFAVFFPKPDKYGFVFYIPAYLLAGYEILYETVHDLFQGKLLDEGFLMSVASIGAFIIGEYPEAVLVMLLFELGEWFEDLAVDKSRKSITDLTGLRPEVAHVIKDEQTTDISPEKVNIGDRILVYPGERIPLDGLVAMGNCELDVSALTGESLPRYVSVGDSVASGSVAANSILHINVTKTLENSTATRILKLVEESENNKSKSEVFTARFARIYTPVVCSAALLLALIPSLITGNVKQWIYRGLLFLVVSCPCALVVSVPLSFFAGIGGAAKKGILIKGGQFLEVLASAVCAVFDKTGTLTDGKLSIIDIQPEKDISKEELLTLIASAEQYSSHPIARCIKNSVKGILPARDVYELPGMGVAATVNGKRILVGNARLARSMNIKIPDNFDAEGTTLFILSDEKYLGKVIVGDLLKPSAQKAIANLNRLGITKTGLLTGDTEYAGKKISRELNLSFYKAELLPEDKVKALEEIMRSNKGKLTLYVGDGINDAPVLARADAGIAMGALGSDAAIEAADIVLMDDDPMKLPLAISAARKTIHIVKQNIAFALIVKLIILILGAFGIANMWSAVFADVGVTALAVLNAMRCLNAPDE